MGVAVGKRDSALNSEINVTPLADVMLVLLIIVMLIAPLLQQGVPVSLPPADNTADKADNDQQTVLHIDAQGRFYVDNIPTDATPAAHGDSECPRPQVRAHRADQGRSGGAVLRGHGPFSTSCNGQVSRTIGLITEKTLEFERGD